MLHYSCSADNFPPTAPVSSEVAEQIPGRRGGGIPCNAMHSSPCPCGGRHRKCGVVRQRPCGVYSATWRNAPPCGAFRKAGYTQASARNSTARPLGGGGRAMGCTECGDRGRNTNPCGVNSYGGRQRNTPHCGVFCRLVGGVHYCKMHCATQRTYPNTQRMDVLQSGPPCSMPSPPPTTSDTPPNYPNWVGLGAQLWPHKTAS